MGVATEVLWVYGFLGSIDQWEKIGSTPYLDAADYPTNYIKTHVTPSRMYYFTFEDTEEANEIDCVLLWLRLKQSWMSTTCGINLSFVGVGSIIQKLIPPDTLGWVAINVTNLLDTWAKINTAKLDISTTAPLAEKTDDLNVDGYVEVNKEWTTYGTPPWIETYNDNKYIFTSSKNAVMEYFTFQDLPETAGHLLSVKLRIVCLQTPGGGNDEIKVEIWDGSSWTVIASNIVPPSSYATRERDVSSILDTVTKINAARMRLTKITVGGAQTIYIDRAYLRVVRKNEFEIDAAKLSIDHFVDVSVETKSPSNCLGDWSNPTNAYESEETQLYASEETDAEEEIYYVYNFSASQAGSIIHKVKIRPKHYENAGAEGIDVYVSWDGGSSWCALGRIQVGFTEEDKATDILDVTDRTEWTPDKLSNANFRTRVRFVSITGGACFDPSTLITMLDGSQKPLEDVKIGDKLLSWCDNRFQETTVRVYTTHEFEGEGKETPRLDFGSFKLVLAEEHMVVIDETNQRMREVPKLQVGEEVFFVESDKKGKRKMKKKMKRKGMVRRKKLINIQTSIPFFFANGVLVHNALKQLY